MTKMHPDLKALSSVLRCPACHGQRIMADEVALTCAGCGRNYQRMGNLLDFLAGERTARSPTQRVMETKSYASVYQRIGRPVLTRLVSSRSLDAEYDLAVRLLKLQEAAVVVDIGCGPGNFARRFVEEMGPGGIVLGVDRSDTMLAEGLRRLGRKTAGHLVFAKADAHHLPIKSHRVDRVHCAGALHLFDDIPRTIGEMKRILRPGGILVISTFVALKGIRHKAIQTLMHQRWGFHWFEATELQALLTSLGFAVDWESTVDAATTVRAISLGA